MYEVVPSAKLDQIANMMIDNVIYGKPSSNGKKTQTLDSLDF